MMSGGEKIVISRSASLVRACTKRIFERGNENCLKYDVFNNVKQLGGMRMSLTRIENWAFEIENLDS